MEPTSESKSVSYLSPEKTRRQAGECLLSPPPYREETETTGVQKARTEQLNFGLTLCPVAGNWQTPPVQRLRLGLKVMLRAFGLRAVGCAPIPPDAKEDKTPRGRGPGQS